MNTSHSTLTPRPPRIPGFPAARVPEAPVVNVDLDEPLLTAQQVAELLHVPRSSVYEYARRPTDRLPSIAVGRHRRFYRSDVETWLASQRTR